MLTFIKFIVRIQAKIKDNQAINIDAPPSGIVFEIA